MMETFFSTVDSLMDQQKLVMLFVLSLVAFVGTLVAIPVILIRLPSDYFSEKNPRMWMADHHPILRGVGLFIKNAIGVVFLLAGFAMLFLPGQGILTMVIGVSLIDFPGKRNIERKLITLPRVLESINALRNKFGKPPFTLFH